MVCWDSERSDHGCWALPRVLAPKQRQPTLDGGRGHQVGHLSGRASTRLRLSCSLGHTRGVRGRRGPLPSPILTPWFSTTAMRGLPSHRLGFLCFLVLICFCFCWFVLNFCLESLHVVGELFLRTFLLSPPAPRGPCISPRYWSGRWLYLVHQL